MENKINSVQNHLVKAMVKLHTAKGRKEALTFIAEGTRTCSSLKENGYEPVFIFVTEEHKNLPPTFKGLDYNLVTDVVMKKMSMATTPSGLLVAFEMPAPPEPKKLSEGLVLAEINDPGNMGTLIRSAAAFDYKSVVIVGGCDPYNPKVLQASAGTVPLINLFQWSWQELLTYKNDLQLIAMVSKDGKKPTELTTKKNLFVIGNEAHGIKKEWVSDCDQLVTLPMPGKTESLNAAVAGSIILALQNK